MKTCLLPGCTNQFNKHTAFCCRSHAGQYSSLSRHNKIVSVPCPTYLGVKDVFIGPPIPDCIKRLRRFKRVRQATPRWANPYLIESIYIEARQLTANTGIKYEVDHIIPIAGKKVCGLHIETNLQILTKEENGKKLNKFTV